MTWKYDPDKITYFADTDFRGQRVRFGIRAQDRERHMYIIGKTGMGKSTLLENLAVQDIQNGEGMCFIDPHGGTAELLLKYVPKERINDVIYFAPFDVDYPVAMNVLEKADLSKRPLIASGLLGAFKKVWPDSFSARMEYMLSNTLLALLEMPGSTLLGVNRMLADKAYRDLVISNITDVAVKAFWVDEFGKWSDKMVAEAVPAIQNKVGQFSANPLIRNILGQTESTFDMRWIMDNRKIFIVNLSKGRLGESNAALIGALLITKMYLAAMSRAEMTPEELKAAPPFYLYVDEFQSFANESFADILSEARKYKLCLTVAHQFIAQMTDEVRAAVFGNVGTMIAFRVGAEDGEALEKEFAPVFTVDDFVSLGFAQVYLKLMIKGAASAPFSARTRDKPPVPEHTYENEVIEASRKQFAKPRLEVEKNLGEWLKIAEGESSSSAPVTRKFAPGARPDRPLNNYNNNQGNYQGNNYQGNNNQGGYQGNSNQSNGFNSQNGFNRPQGQYQQNQSGALGQRPQIPGGIGLRDALARANVAGAQDPNSQTPNQGYQNQFQQTPAQMGGYQQYGQAYPQQYGNYQNQAPYPQAPFYPYMPPQPMMIPPQHYGYPYAMPPQPYMYGQPQYYQTPPQYVPPPQYPPAPTYGYQPNHPGYNNFAQQAQNNSNQNKPQIVEKKSIEPASILSDKNVEVKNDFPPIKEKPVIDDKKQKVEVDKQTEIKEKPKPNFVKRDDKKGPTPEKLDSLQEALLKLQNKVSSIPSIDNIGKTTDKKEEVVAEEKPKEIPEDELKKILE